MQKAFNSKTENKQKNETMNMLYHLSNKATSYKLNKTIKSFHTHKPEIKSSRIESTAAYFKK